MSRRSNRPRGRGSRPFVMFYTDMLQHPNFRRLSRRAVKLLMNVSASYSGFNNGDLAVTLTVMAPFGWKSNDQELCNRIINEIEAPFFKNGVKKYGWHLTIKVALEHFGIMSKHDRMPLMPLPISESNNLKQLFDSFPVNELIQKA